MNQAARGLTVAVTGPTGDIGRAFVRALEAEPQVARIIGMARRPFDPTEMGWAKTEYRRGDILAPASVESLVEGADAVVHLAFLIFGSIEETTEINIEGSRNVFKAAVGARIPRLVYTSSVAAYGFHEDNPEVLSETVPPRGTENHYYSAQKAQLEAILAELTAGSDTQVYVFRPCIVAGPTALSLITQIPYVQLGEKLPSAVKRFVETIPLLRPVIPDPGVPIQLVHEDDVAAAMAAAALGRGSPGTYNLAADGEITLTDLAHSLGCYAIPIPELAVDATSRIVSRLPLMPARAAWLNAIRVPVLMDTGKARAELGWSPRYDALDTLAQTVQSARVQGLVPWRERVP